MHFSEQASQASGITPEPDLGKTFTIQKIGAPRSYAVSITICGTEWGWMVLGVFVVGGGAYVGGGVLLGQRSGGQAGLTAHMHSQQWMELAGLAKDGVKYSEGVMKGNVSTVVLHKACSCSLSLSLSLLTGCSWLQGAGGGGGGYTRVRETAGGVRI